MSYQIETADDFIESGSKYACLFEEIEAKLQDGTGAKWLRLYNFGGFKEAMNVYRAVRNNMKTVEVRFRKFDKDGVISPSVYVKSIGGQLNK